MAKTAVLSRDELVQKSKRELRMIRIMEGGRQKQKTEA